MNCFSTSFVYAAIVVQKEKPPMNVVGDVHERIAIVIVSSLQLAVFIILHHFDLEFRMTS